MTSNTPTLQQVYNKLFLINSRPDRIEYLTKLWWPDLSAVHMSVLDFYQDIPKTFQQYKSPFIVYQASDEWLDVCDYNQVRQQMIDYPRWNNDSFVISKNRWDCEQMDRLGIRNYCKPDLVDLICYESINQPCWDPTEITHHSSFILPDRQPAQEMLFNHLIHHRDKFLVLTHANKFYNYKRHDLAFEVGQEILRYSRMEFSPTSTNILYAGAAFGIATDSRLEKPHCFSPGKEAFRMFHLQKPFVLCGGQNTKQYLVDLGFDLFDWLIDWSFDSIADPDHRYQGFIYEIDRLLHIPLQDLVDLIDRNKASMIHNQNHIQHLIVNYHTIDNR